MSSAPIRIDYTPGNPDTARATVAGTSYSTASTAGAVFALCRELVADGVPDCAYEGWPEGRPYPGLVGPSFHAAARLTCKGTRFVPFIPTPGRTSDSPMRAGDPPATTLAA